jgi:thioredoxin 2
VLETLAVTTDGRLSVVKVDVDVAPSLARRFEVQSIPTLVVLVGGVEQARYIGARSIEALQGELEPFLA